MGLGFRIRGTYFVSGLIIGITRVTMWVIGVINLPTKSL